MEKSDFEYDVLYLAVLAAMLPDPLVSRPCGTIINRCGVEEYPKERKWVGLAVLKLAALNFVAVERYRGCAMAYFRDVLAWAEYPEANRPGSWRLCPNSTEMQQIIKNSAPVPGMAG